MATTRIFVKGLPPSISEIDFRNHFSAGGREITDVKLIPQRRIGYVGYKTPEDAQKAVKYFNKSYVRMSKVSVEPAKAISDPSLNRHQSSNQPGRFPAKRKATEETVLDDSGPKKIKRDEPDPSDPKLREFLKVIGSTRESALADVAPVDQVSMPDVPQVAGPDAESDDEYQSIPSRKDKQWKTEVSEEDRAVRNHTIISTSPQEQESLLENTQHETMTGQQEQDPADQHQKGATTTDDDWMRSRTNRLLDLVDPDDLSPPADDSKKSPLENLPLRQDIDPRPDPVKFHQEPAQKVAKVVEIEAPKTNSTLDTIHRTSRLFVRNLAFTATEEDIRGCFEKFGTVEEVHLPTDKTGSKKGFALVLFENSSEAVEAFQSMDGATFQGRLLHIIPADAKRDSGLNDFEISKLPLKKQNQIRKKTEAAATTFNWNSLYMSQDAVNSSVANRLGVSKSELLDPTSADAAVKQAIAETSVILETKAYFVANGVDLDAFRSTKRGDTAILVKNFSYGTTIEELRTLFEESGPILRVLMPPSGTIAIVQFAQPNHAKTAFGKMAYRRVKDSVLFLEKAPKDLFTGKTSLDVPQLLKDRPTGTQKLNVDELLSRGDKEEGPLETTSLFVRNLNFETTTDRLKQVFESLDGFVAARVKMKNDPKKPGQILSMGFGFVEFKTKAQAQEALKVMDGYVLDRHTLAVKASHKGLDAAEERRRDDKAKNAPGQRTKIIVKNLPFQATKKDIRALFGTYGQLRSVRVPKKADFTTRGFAFADFITPREAENALNALKDTHLLGRKLVLDFAEADAVDAEEEIKKMQRKVGGQMNKMALQQLTGGGRTKVNIGNDEEEL